MSAPEIEIIHRLRWRSPEWPADVPSCEGWQVKCSEHGLLGNPAGWAYASPGRAQGVATRHRQLHERRAAP